MKELERRRRIYAVAQRAIDYYVDTGLCVFCAADDVVGISHDSGDVPCDVGVLSGVVVDAARRKEKKRQRDAADKYLEDLIRGKSRR